jgi:4-hydroxy-3-polyprenylbenzoate decarboxylase
MSLPEPRGQTTGHTPDQITNETEAARDLRAALADLQADPFIQGTAETKALLRKNGFPPDAACADFAQHHAGLPARPRTADEPAVLYTQPNAPDLLLGLYGSEKRLRDWTPALRTTPLPAAAQTFEPKAAVLRDDDHSLWPMIDLQALPIPKISPRDAGPYVTMGFVLATPAGCAPALSAHRMLVLDSSHLGISMLTSRHLRHLAESAWASGQDLPISINIGVPPAVAIASATATAHLPAGLDKLALAGGLAEAPVSLGQFPSQQAWFLNQSEFVLHGQLTAQTYAEILPPRPVGITMPEFLGYDGRAGAPIQVTHITGISQRPNAVFQSTLGPGREQSTILALGGALALSFALPETLRCEIADLRYSPAGGGMLLLYVALRPKAKVDKAQLAEAIIKIMPFTKTIIFVDVDIDLNCDGDVAWAMTTRCNLAHDCHALSGFPPLRMDPSQSGDWGHTATGETRGHPCRSWVDATCPPHMADRTVRSFPP